MTSKQSFYSFILNNDRVLDINLLAHSAKKARRTHGMLMFCCGLVFAVAVFALVIFAIVGGFAVVTGRHCDLTQFATAAAVLHIVVFACAHVAQYGLLVLHYIPP